MADLDRQFGLAEPDDSYPDIRNVHEHIGRALMQLAILTFGNVITKRPDGENLETVADLKMIRGAVLNVNDTANPTLAQIGRERQVWGFFRFMNEPETSTQQRPDDVPQDQPGMWVLQVLPSLACCGANRYIAHAEYLSEQVDTKMLWDRARGKTPAIFISPAGDDIEEASQTMAFHRMVARYQIRGVSANWRGGVSARMTPPLADEAANDPGTFRMLGDLRRMFISDNLLGDVLGVVKTSLGGLRNGGTQERDAERLICDAMDLRVIAYVHTPNTPCEVTYPWQMWIQLQNELRQNAGDRFVVPPQFVPGA
jgi:hypothetical protein